MEFKGPWGWTLNGIVIGIAIFNVAGVAGTGNMAISGLFWGVLGPQSAIFGGQKGSKLTPQMYNVQHCSTNVQPICGR